jgi:hypothetical protein
MTIKIKVECDLSGCDKEIEIDDNHDSDVEREGWAVNPIDGDQHYCETCWPLAKAEIEEYEVEKDKKKLEQSTDRFCRPV